MVRYSLLALAGLALLVAPAGAKTWSGGLFEQSNHDFGSVPRGPVLTHYYNLTNNTQSAIHIAGVRVSCGCVSANAMKQDLAPGESTAILAQMDTRRFVGSKSVTIFVTFDRPNWEEARLTISAYGRDDMSLEPDGLAFGSVTRGATGTARMTVTLRQLNWVVQSAKSDSTFVLPSVKELRRSQTDVAYEVVANLAPGLPVGTWTTEVTLTTNSPIAPTIRVPATVTITPTLTVSPSEVNLNAITIGSPSESKLLIRGGQPFKIKEIIGLDGIVSAATPTEAKPVHVLTLKVDPKDAGDLLRKLKVVTDLPADGVVEVSVKAKVSAK